MLMEIKLSKMGESIFISGLAYPFESQHYEKMEYVYF